VDEDENVDEDEYVDVDEDVDEDVVGNGDGAEDVDEIEV
jgi:hypothetical protein